MRARADECARILKRWVTTRRYYEIQPGCQALFVSEQGGRLKLASSTPNRYLTSAIYNIGLTEIFSLTES